MTPSQTPSTSLSSSLSSFRSMALSSTSRLLSKGGESLNFKGQDSIGSKLLSVSNKVGQLGGGARGIPRVGSGSGQRQYHSKTQSRDEEEELVREMDFHHGSKANPNPTNKTFTSHLGDLAYRGGSLAFAGGKMVAGYVGSGIEASKPAIKSAAEGTSYYFSKERKEKVRLEREREEREWNSAGGDEEEVIILPGFANISQGSFEHPLKLDLLINGYAHQNIRLSALSRSQRVTLGVLKSLAGLPRLPGQEDLDPTAEELQLGLELETEGRGGQSTTSLLERKEIQEQTKNILGDDRVSDEPKIVGGLKRINTDTSIVSVSTTNSSSSFSSSGKRFPPEIPEKKFSNSNPYLWKPVKSQIPVYHVNLTTRLRPFFSKKLNFRSIFLEVWGLHAPPVDVSSLPDDKGQIESEIDLVDGVIGKVPLLRKTIPTGEDGMFRTRISLSLPNDTEPLIGIRIIGTLFEQTEEEDYVSMVSASNSVEATTVKDRWEEALQIDDRNFPDNMIQGPHGWIERRKRIGKTGISDLGVRLKLGKKVAENVTVISDIDDTIKHSHVLGGVRTLMRNVFALPINDVVVDGMSRWFKTLENAGAQFAFVSNGPIEAWTFTNQFLQHSGMPRGPVLMKSYGSGMAFLSKMMEESGARKRATLESAIEEFKGSKFILVGDSGEADLELYVSMAKKYTGRILAIFIRDVTTPHILRDTKFIPPPAAPLITPIEESLPPLPDPQTPKPSPPSKPPKPTSLSSTNSQTSSLVPPLPPPSSTKPSPTTTTSRPVPSKRQNSLTVTHSSGASQEVRGLTAHVPLDFFAQNVELTESQMTALEKFYSRIWNAENQLPLGVKLRIFSKPEECLELSLNVIEGSR